MTRDVLLGLAIAALGAAYFHAAGQLMAFPGMGLNPGFFPKIIAGFAVATGLLMVARAFSQGARGPQGAEEAPDGVGDSAEPIATSVIALRVASVFAAVTFYALAVEHIGFAPSVAVIVFALALVFGARLRLALPVAIAAALVFTLVFSELLRVPLPPSFLSHALSQLTAGG